MFKQHLLFPNLKRIHEHSNKTSSVRKYSAICDLSSQEMEDNFQLVYVFLTNYAFLYRYTLYNLSRQQDYKVARLWIVGTKQVYST